MSNEHILVVDDNPTNLKLVSDLLECSGYQVTRATDAEQALAIVRRAPPDLILMDIGLPGMDGLTLTRRFKAGETTRNIRIIALTAFAMKGDKQKALDAGCDGYITKPIDTRSLPAQVDRCLQGGETSMKILIVEDEPVSPKLAPLVLAAAGHGVTGAGAVGNAVAAILRSEPDVILLGLEPPGIANEGK